MIRAIRKRLGKVKCLLIDELPYANAMKSVSGIREKFRHRLARLPPVAGEEGKDIEVHMLCGTGSADMGMWASWSLMRYIPAGKFILHSVGDGSKPDFLPVQNRTVC